MDVSVGLIIVFGVLFLVVFSILLFLYSLLRFLISLIFGKKREKPSKDVGKKAKEKVAEERTQSVSRPASTRKKDLVIAGLFILLIHMYFSNEALAKKVSKLEEKLITYVGYREPELVREGNTPLTYSEMAKRYATYKMKVVEYEKYKSQYEACQFYLETLNESVEELKRKNDNLYYNLKECEDEKSEVEEELNECQENASKLAFEIAAWKITYNKCREDLDEYFEKYKRCLQDKLELSGDLSKLEEEKERLEREKAEKDKELEAMRQQLEQTSYQLSETQSQLSQTQSELETTQARFDELKREYEDAKEDIEKISSELSELLMWFSENSRFSTSSSVIREIEEKCTEGAKLNLACIPYVLENEYSIHYFSESGSDRIRGLEEIMNRQGGDCDDFAMLVKGILESLKEKKYIAVAWTPKEGERFIIYREGNQFWYYEGEEHIIGDLSNFHLYMVCYMKGSKSGHCVVALSSRKISGISDVENLNGALVIEPQNGKYLGKVGSEFKVCEDYYNCYVSPKNSIMLIVTDEDLYYFLYSKHRWRSYGYLKEKLEETAEEMEKELENFE